MKDEFTSDEIRTEAAFENALGGLIHAALQNGVDPCGSWVYDTDAFDTDLEAVIVELAADSD